jgi:hypothetical protein
MTMAAVLGLGLMIAGALGFPDPAYERVLTVLGGLLAGRRAYRQLASPT